MAPFYACLPPRSSPGALLCRSLRHRVVHHANEQGMLMKLNPSGMLTSNWSNRMAHMDVQLDPALTSPLFLAFIGWEMLYLRKHGAAYPTAGCQWKDLFANATRR